MRCAVAVLAEQVAFCDLHAEYSHSTAHDMAPRAGRCLMFYQISTAGFVGQKARR